ncbi:hypothetical protein MATL_G00186910 [Megalops atlanticus]|uniref:Transmembrane protein 229B n=1 Tax=Megalops atlanticus TaxID=7932 RepID=A0A9D3PKS8_MEGAT|nr:hypothetical protein MATL_G00186910 [Megalops atlanticus]
MDAGRPYHRRTEGAVRADSGTEASCGLGGNAVPRPLTPLGRFYVYALHGCLCEVLFTAAWDLYERGDRKLAGHTSLWALPIYGAALLLIERLHLWLQPRCPLLARLLVYTLFTYLWEFGTGLLLRLLGACPWDYSAFRYNLRGLVTLEYALPWATGCFIAEQHVIKNALRVRLWNSGQAP